MVTRLQKRCNVKKDMKYRHFLFSNQEVSLLDEKTKDISIYIFYTYIYIYLDWYNIQQTAGISIKTPHKLLQLSSSDLPFSNMTYFILILLHYHFWYLFIPEFKSSFQGFFFACHRFFKKGSLGGEIVTAV